MAKLSTFVNTSNAFYLSVEKQREWETAHGPVGDFARSSPWSHFSRKNIGYFFAIAHHAEFIFYFDDDNFIQLDSNGSPIELLPPGKDVTKMKLPNTSIVMQGAYAFNHHPVMGASVPNSWPRGFPLSLIKNNATQGADAFEMDLPFATRDQEIGVIQYLADGDPDIDAIHRMTRTLPMYFEGDKSVLTPMHSYSPYNAQATVHSKNALWAMLLPSTVPGRVSDIWRSYFAQCIFADAGLRLVFSPSIVTQERNDHDYRKDFNAEHDLYEKAEKLIEYLREWDSSDDTVPARMESLWIDLYECGYIEIEDVFSVQLWLQALAQVGYDFPSLKRRHRNVVLMGQFNYADSESTVDDVIFWTQKHREHFCTVVAAGPFSASQMWALEENSISVLPGDNDRGYYSPMKNLKNTLLAFKNSTKVEGVLYSHDDGILNLTELSPKEEYPFPTSQILATGRDPLVDAYRAYPDGHTETFDKSTSFKSLGEMISQTRPLQIWPHFNQHYCSKGQMKLVKDPSNWSYQESDGSILFPSFQQSDFAFVPTEYTDVFVEGVDLHLKYGIWIECAFPKIFHMVSQETKAQVHNVDLCTSWGVARGDPQQMAKICSKYSAAVGFSHPLKISKGYDIFSTAFDQLQTAHVADFSGTS